MSAEPDTKVLRAIAARRDQATGWSHVERRQQWVELSGLSKSTWHRVADRLAARGFLQAERVDRADGRPKGYLLLPPGLAALELLGPDLSQDLSHGDSVGTGHGTGGVGGVSSSSSASSSSPASSKREIPHPLEPRTIATDLSHEPSGWDRSDDRRAQAHRLLDLVLGFGGVETRMDEVKAPALEPVKRATVAVVRADGLFWDAESEPDLARELEAFRAKRSNRPDLGHAWELARQHPAEWVMRALAHSAIRWATGHRIGWRINDAWGYFWKSLGQVVKGQGVWAGLDFDARMPDARDSFRAGLAACAALSDAEARALRRVGLKVVESAPPMDELLERQRRGAKLIGLPARLPPAPSLVDALVAEGPTRRDRPGRKVEPVGQLVGKICSRADSAHPG